MRIAITGGTGFIGKNIVRHLLLKGHEILLLTHNAKLKIKSDHFKSVKCDITNLKTLEQISVKKIDVLLHLAAQSSGPKSFEIPEIDIKTNIFGTLNMIKWCDQNNIKRILFASSFTVYGDVFNEEKLKEDFSCKPKSVYGLSKYACENLLRIYGMSLGIEWNALRMFNVYGQGQDSNLKDQGIVNIFKDFIINGNYIPVKGSLNRFRDFIYIDDVVDAWEACLMIDKNPNQVSNLASGDKTHISELINVLIEKFGNKKDIKIEEIGSTHGDIMGCYADISKFCKDFNFKPKHSLNEGIAKMFEFENKN